jgi:hypothetical protein
MRTGFRWSRYVTLPQINQWRRQSVSDDETEELALNERMVSASRAILSNDRDWSLAATYPLVPRTQKRSLSPPRPPPNIGRSFILPLVLVRDPCGGLCLRTGKPLADRSGHRV